MAVEAFTLNMDALTDNLTLCDSERDRENNCMKSGHASCLYKTELCRSFSEKGHCKYGSKCQFAHGIEELRVVSRHPKYKTEVCRSFHTTGSCQYGVRCRFIHVSPRLEYERQFFQETPKIFKDPLGNVEDLIENFEMQESKESKVRLPFFKQLISQSHEDPENSENIARN